jgi:hypothetical protein
VSLTPARDPLVCLLECRKEQSLLRTRPETLEQVPFLRFTCLGLPYEQRNNDPVHHCHVAVINAVSSGDLAGLEIDLHPKNRFWRDPGNHLHTGTGKRSLPLNKLSL